MARLIVKLILVVATVCVTQGFLNVTTGWVSQENPVEAWHNSNVDGPYGGDSVQVHGEAFAEAPSTASDDCDDTGEGTDAHCHTNLGNPCPAGYDEITVYLGTMGKAYDSFPTKVTTGYDDEDETISCDGGIFN
jgi:hypothetical protein